MKYTILIDCETQTARFEKTETRAEFINPADQSAIAARAMGTQKFPDYAANLSDCVSPLPENMFDPILRTPADLASHIGKDRMSVYGATVIKRNMIRNGVRQQHEGEMLDALHEALQNLRQHKREDFGQPSQRAKVAEYQNYYNTALKNFFQACVLNGAEFPWPCGFDSGKAP